MRQLAWVVLALGASLLGCAPRSATLRNQEELRAEFLQNVPFYPDSTKLCGPSALASVLGYWQIRASRGELEARVYLERLEGSLPMDLVSAARDYGLKADLVRGNLDLLRSEIGSGRPVIVLVNLGASFYAVHHFMVVTGYDDAKGEIIAHSSLSQNRAFPYASFLRWWKKADACAILISPRESPHVQSVFALP
jgi:ABC-type bacteriocin/lantibiotic exporter with double-glycine peptidase domain